MKRALDKWVLWSWHIMRLGPNLQKIPGNLKKTFKLLWKSECLFDFVLISANGNSTFIECLFKREKKEFHLYKTEGSVDACLTKRHGNKCKCRREDRGWKIWCGLKSRSLVGSSMLWPSQSLSSFLPEFFLREFFLFLPVLACSVEIEIYIQFSLKLLCDHCEKCHTIKSELNRTLREVRNGKRTRGECFQDWWKREKRPGFHSVPAMH